MATAIPVVASSTNSLGWASDCYTYKQLWPILGSVWWWRRHLRGRVIHDYQVTSEHENGRRIAVIYRTIWHISGIIPDLPFRHSSYPRCRWYCLLGSPSGQHDFNPQICLPNGTAEQIQQLLKPTLDALDISNVPYRKWNRFKFGCNIDSTETDCFSTDFNAKNYDTFQDAHHTLNPSLYVSELNIGGRLVPRSIVDSSNSIGDLVKVVKQIIESGAIFAGVCLDVRKEPTSPNAILPAWRNAFFLAFLGM